MRRSARYRRIKLAALVCSCGAVLFPVLGCLTHHFDETVILLMPPALCGFLWVGWPEVRRVSVVQLGVYLAVLVAVVGGAQAFTAHMARGRVIWVEVFWAIYFIVAWRAAWAVWARTIGSAGERYRRWGRIASARAGGLLRMPVARELRLAALTKLIAPVRFCLVLFVFAPLVVGSLVHRIKIGNPEAPEDYAHVPIEDVSFTTQDGLTLSGWFLPDNDSDTTVVICHGLGANKHNFVDFVNVFYGRGYSSLIFDFRGHGDSDGHTSTFGLLETADVRAAVDWLKRERPDRAVHIYGLGSSMGAMALVRTAAFDQRIEAVVLDSCFVSAPALVRQHLGRIPIVGGLFGDLVLASASLHIGASIWNLDASDAIARLSPRPVLLVHGKDDFVMPPQNLDVLYRVAGEPKEKWLGPGPHSNIMTTDFDGYQSRVLGFFDQQARRTTTRNRDS